RHVALEQRHQRRDLRPRAIPVLLRERVQRQDLEPDLHRPLHDLAHRLHARRVAARPREPALPRPATVAVHADRHMTRDPAVYLDVLEEIRWHEFHDVSPGSRLTAAAGTPAAACASPAGPGTRARPP